MSQIDNELEKLQLNSSKNQVIRPEEVENIIGFSKEFNFFELTKEIGKNNYQKSQAFDFIHVKEFKEISNSSNYRDYIFLF